jgi:hypothetical protein
MNDFTTHSYLGKTYTVNNCYEFIQAARKTMAEDEERGIEVDHKLFSLKTLKEFYDTEVMAQKNMIEIILPSYQNEPMNVITQFVANNWWQFRDKVVILNYPREIELIVMPLLFPVSKAVIARTNSVLNAGICVYSKDSNYVIGQTYKW